MTDLLQDKTARCKAAFDAYAALHRAIKRDHTLARNPYFTALQDAAYSRFKAAWEAM
jgi:hypothetical protein